MIAALVLVASFGTVSVTNHAGYVMTGELTTVTNGRFTVGGRTMPLKILPKAEQERLWKLAGGDTRTPDEKRRARMAANDLKRIDALVAAGKIKPEDAEKMRKAIQAAGTATRNPNPKGDYMREGR